MSILQAAMQKCRQYAVRQACGGASDADDMGAGRSGRSRLP